MKFLVFLLLIISFSQEVPFKSKDEFEVKLDYQFKQRPPDDNTVIHVDETHRDRERRTSTAILPYLILNVKMLQTGEASRVRISTNISQQTSIRKIKEGVIIPIEIGFTDDAKDRVTAHEYALTLLTDDRAELSRIVLFIGEDGTFLVNGERRGRF
jgi:hypothetical protein